MSEETTFTKDHVRNFQEHVIWQEITATLLQRIEIHRGELEVTPFSDLSEIAKLQGAIMEIKYFLSLPIMMMEEPTPIIKEDEKE